MSGTSRPSGSSATTGAPRAGIADGTPAFRRMTVALFLGGFSTFSLLYCVQPLLPAFARSFDISPAESALALSVTTGTLAFAIVVAGAFSQGLGRRGVMLAAMALGATANLAAAAAPTWPLFLVARAVEGLLLGGVPAVAMAYIAEEVEPRSLGRAMGLYIAGTAMGAMIGRVGMGLFAEYGSWRTALGIIGLADLAAAAAFYLLLPPSRNFQPQRGVGLGFHLAAWRDHLRNGSLVGLFAVGFALTSVFVTVFNYAGFRLEAPPYSLSQLEASLIFLVYGFGIVSSSSAGLVAERIGWRGALVAGFLTMAAGIALTLAAPLALVVAGVSLVTIGFFIGHAVASGLVGRFSGSAKGHASSLYLLFYYIGASVTGTLGGWFWEHGGWPAVAALTAGLATAGAVVGGLVARGRGS